MRHHFAQESDSGEGIAPQDFLHGVLCAMRTEGTCSNPTVHQWPPTDGRIRRAVNRGGALETPAAYIHVRRPTMLRTEARNAFASISIAGLPLTSDCLRAGIELARHELAALVTAVNVARPTVHCANRRLASGQAVRGSRLTFRCAA